MSGVPQPAKDSRRRNSKENWLRFPYRARTTIPTHSIVHMLSQQIEVACQELKIPLYSGVSYLLQ